MDLSTPLARNPQPGEVRFDVSRLTEQDLYLFNEGTHYRLHEKLGSHPMDAGGEAGVYFAVWAPAAERVSVIGDFNGWDRGRHALRSRGSSGIWEGFIPGLPPGTLYKYNVVGLRGVRGEKADPMAYTHETPPRTASRVWPLDYAWGDAAWMAARGPKQSLSAPMAIYEMHLGSWKRPGPGQGEFLNYRQIGDELVPYLKRMGFTHVEFMPVMEHPFYGSWGYQVTGFFAPSHRFGSPQDFMTLVDRLHQEGIGVLLDWVPSHFPSDGHGLGFFDGTYLYEHADPRLGYHPDWNSLIFNYGRNEVRSFLISNACFWLERYHADGLRVDAVASMLYLDYSRKEGEWIPNKYGGKENLQAIDFLRQLNGAVYGGFPDIQMVAEESTSWPMVSRPAYLGGLGFGLKWDMGWMHDTLAYFQRRPIHRRFHHNELTFRMLYAWHENFVLPLSHDEVVHGKGSLIGRMPGDTWQKFANLRLLLGSMYGQPGKKLLFMGDEMAQWHEWNHEGQLDWPALDNPSHAGVSRWVADLNRLYRQEPAMHELDCDSQGFEWVDANASDDSILSWLRRGRSGSEAVLVVCNFTPVPRKDYLVGVPFAGRWTELLNSDAKDYQGSGIGNVGGVEADAVERDGRPFSLKLALPPLAIVMFKGGAPPPAALPGKRKSRRPPKTDTGA